MGGAALSNLYNTMENAQTGTSQRRGSNDERDPTPLIQPLINLEIARATILELSYLLQGSTLLLLPQTAAAIDKCDSKRQNPSPTTESNMAKSAKNYEKKKLNKAKIVPLSKTEDDDDDDDDDDAIPEAPIDALGAALQGHLPAVQRKVKSVAKVVIFMGLAEAVEEVSKVYGVRV